jgi:hypothetical protein
VDKHVSPEASETDCVAGHVGFEPANPSGHYLIGIASATVVSADNGVCHMIHRLTENDLRFKMERYEGFDLSSF